MKFYDGYGKEVSVGTPTNVVKGEKIIDTSVYVNTGYSETLQSQYGSNVNLYGDFIDVSENKVLYRKAPMYNKSTVLNLYFGCYDAEKNFLYVSNNSENVKVGILASSGNLEGIGTDAEGKTIYNLVYEMFTFPEEVKFVMLCGNGSAIHSNVSNELFILSREPIRDLWQTWDDYVTILSETYIHEADKYNLPKAPVGVFIGDSLTDWGGGNDDTNGFLKVIHEKTGLITKNEGTAGAWWQGDAVSSAVTRVNTIVSEGRKYNVYCFIMGTNAGSNTDTGETSADTTTMSGAIRYCLETLKKYQPTAKIIVCLPPQRAEGNENQEKVNEVIKKIAESYSVKTLDLYHHSGAVPNTVVPDSNYLSDGLHLGENGYTVIGDLLASEIKYHLCL